MRAPRFLAGLLATAAVAAAFTPTAAAQGMDEDPERECIEPVPASASVQGITDEGQQVELSTIVLLDGVSKARGQEVMARAADAYAPASVTLTSRFERVAFAGDDAQGLIDQAKARFGGQRPGRTDLVYVLTAKDIQLDGNTGVAGLADCIGGVRFPERAFAVGEEGNFVDFDSIHFSMLNRQVVRGHAVDFASP